MGKEGFSSLWYWIIFIIVLIIIGIIFFMISNKPVDTGLSPVLEMPPLP